MRSSLDRNLLIAFLLSFLVLFLWGRLQEQQYPSASQTTASETVNTDGKISAGQPKDMSDVGEANSKPASSSAEQNPPEKNVAENAGLNAAETTAAVSNASAAKIVAPSESEEQSQEQIIEIKLLPEEQQMLLKSIKAVQELVGVLKTNNYV